MSILSWFRGFNQKPQPSNLLGKEYDALPQAAPEHLVNSILRDRLEQLKEKLEKKLEVKLVLASMKPSEVMALQPSRRPLHYTPEFGFLLQYLAYADVDHRQGTMMIDAEEYYKPLWIFCMNPDGLRVITELFIPELEQDIVSLLHEQAVGNWYTCSVTVTSFPKYRRCHLLPHGSTTSMKHTIPPTPSITPYRRDGTQTSD